MNEQEFACWTDHPHYLTIAFVNVFMGWLILPYLICLIWALIKPRS